jgi:two-component system sensor histidine kinase BarA
MTPLVDYTHALQQANGNETLAKDLFGMLLTELPELYTTLETAWQQQDAAALRDHAHKIFGSTAYCGVPDLTSCAKALEDALKSGSDQEIVTTHVENLGKAVDRLLAEGPSLLKQAWN